MIQMLDERVERSCPLVSSCLNPGKSLGKGCICLVGPDELWHYPVIQHDLDHRTGQKLEYLAVSMFDDLTK